MNSVKGKPSQTRAQGELKPVLRLMFILLLLVPSAAFGDAGVLIPSNRKEPDPSILSLAEMVIDVLIDNGDARVRLLEIFASHTSEVLEGNYIFALPGRAIVSDFAVWDGVTRIPGVILERKRAEEIYNNLKWQAIDPGLLQVGERDVEEARRTTVFSARIVPIPAQATKRIEMEYHESIPVEEFKSVFSIPLRPDAYREQTAGKLSIRLEIHSPHALADFEGVSRSYPLRILERTPHSVKASFESQNVNLVEDFGVRYALDQSRADTMEILTYRNPIESNSATTAAPPAPAGNEPGFFEASALLGAGPKASAAGGQATKSSSGPPRTVIALFDNSLSMQWEKLERSFQALETLLRELRRSDRFNLLLYNSDVMPFSPQPVAAEAATIDKALTYVRASRLRGATNLQRALEAALGQSTFPGNENYLVILTDGGATRGLINNGKLAAWYAARWGQVPAHARPRTYIFAVGDDANIPLLRMLARNDGVLEWVRSTEPIEFKLNAFLSKIGRRPVQQLRLGTAPESNFDLVYSLEDTTFSGSVASWIGQYKRPAQSASFTARGVRESQSFEIRAKAPLPVRNTEHSHLPRAWAKARVDALLERIEREGEDQATIDEIIRLARKYKFVTPYTSFLAAPRALLRPRVIRPGDPILRVKTDESIVSVVALFPFGLIKKLRYLKDEDTWQTRFLAPTDMADGTYRVRLVLRDAPGHVYRETKSFVIASKPPVVRVRLERSQFRRGESVYLRVSASEHTRTVTARMYGLAPISLHWDPQARANTGQLAVPADLPSGRYILTVTAEDLAHNIGSQEVAVEVVP